MARQRIRRLGNMIIGVLKDKTALAKALALSGRSSTRVAVLRATTRHPSSSPPSERRVAAVLDLCLRGQGVSALMDRLARTRSAVVALKCLLVAHRAASRSCFGLHDRGGRNFLNLSAFRDDSDERARELSAWVRWFAAAVDHSLAVSRAIGYYLSPDTAKSRHNLSPPPSSELLRELDALVTHVERTRDVPDSVHYLQKNDLVYEVLRLVREDYKLVQREILARVGELGRRIEGNYKEKGLSLDELTRVLDGLKRLEDCKERLVSIFLKKRRDDEFWDEIGRLKMKVMEILMGKTLLLLTDRDRDYDRVNLDYQRIKGSDSRFLNNPFVEQGQWLMLPGSNGGWSSYGPTSVSV